MKTDQALTIKLSDYRPHAYHITNTNLDIDLGFSTTEIIATHEVVRRDNAVQELVLDAEQLSVLEVAINGQTLAASAYQHKDDQLIIACDYDRCTLTIRNVIDPSKNTALSGLYQSADMLCTQCEAEGFRRITPAIDRPDNLAIYQVKLSAPQQLFPILLCNGNETDHGTSNDGKHFSVWHDPYPKPTYLFALVAGPLSCVEDSYTTSGGRDVALKFFARGDDIDLCQHAMNSLKNAMRWDEDTYQLEYDLDVYHVVAVGDFNMGAMENKSLNVFNSKYVLANPQTATDSDYQSIEDIIGHEYFHNWSGNRVTCRDWFQLSLKEGFTVFREQQFSAAMGSAGVKRIDDVNLLRTIQFPEDAGPVAHPVQPQSYQEINNFYTTTIYNKGAEVVRMIFNLVGSEAFYKGVALYFERHDGAAVTTDDFVAAIADSSGYDLNDFKRWYTQAGTPNVSVSQSYDSDAQRLTLSFSQSCPATPGQKDKAPFVIPIITKLFNQQGAVIKATLNDIGDDIGHSNNGEFTLVLGQAEQQFIFNNVIEKPLVSLLRGFSAPIKLTSDLDKQQRILLSRYDDDAFNRWEMLQTLASEQLLNLLTAPDSDIDGDIVDLYGDVLDLAHSDPRLAAACLSLPNERILAEQSRPIYPQQIRAARQRLQAAILQRHEAKLLDTYMRMNAQSDGAIDSAQAASRALRDACLNYLLQSADHQHAHLAIKQLDSNLCMTDSLAALNGLVQAQVPASEPVLQSFYEQWKDNALVIDKWLRCQAVAPADDIVARLSLLCQHQAFDAQNPNKVYSLIAAFAHGNPSGFHSDNGAGYRFVREWVETLDSINPQVAARVVGAFSSWRRYAPALAELMREQLQLLDDKQCSKDVAEIVSKALAN